MIAKYKIELIGVALGVVAGFSYWYFFGCTSGTCLITSSPINSSIYGALMGGLFANLFRKENKQKEEIK
jgi:LytS/YehU family sensor histidine kinase